MRGATQDIVARDAVLGVPVAASARRGIINTEMMASIVILMLVAGLLLTMSSAYVRSRGDLMRERVLRLAAQAQLERYRAGVRLDTPPPADTLPDGVTLKTTTTPGSGVWTGMTQVTVTASALDVKKREHHVTISGYLREVSTK